MLEDEKAQYIFVNNLVIYGSNKAMCWRSMYKSLNIRMLQDTYPASMGQAKSLNNSDTVAILSDHITIA